MEIIIAVILFLLGISVGSFLNVVADRIPMGKSIISPPSHCFNCGHRLESRDMFPVVSYLLLKGKCRYCSASIPPRSMVIELLTGLVYVAAVVILGLTWKLAGSLIVISIFIVLAIADIETGHLPYRILYPSIGIVLLVAIANTLTGTQPDILSSLAGCALAAGVFIVIWGIPRLFKQQVMRFGDIGMAALVGLSTGYPQVIIAAYLAVLVAGLTMLTLIIVRQRKTSDPVSFGLYLTLGTVGTIFWGQQILSVAVYFLSGLAVN